jgi:hypothetical protein
MEVTNEMVEAGLISYLKTMKVEHPAESYDQYTQGLWRDQVRAILEAGLNVCGWRDTDTLPEIGESVLVFCPGNRRPVQEAMRLIEHEGATSFYWGPGDRGYMILPEGVKMWRPMPTPPNDGHS